MGASYIIAEAGVNHNGSLDLALALVDAAVAARADAVKFQTFKAASLVTSKARKAAYQDRAVGAESSQYDLIRGLELDEDAHRRIQERCRSAGIDFLSTPFDLQSLRLLVELGVARLKASSGDLTNLPLLRALGATRLPCIVSTGMGTLSEVEGALGGLVSGALSTESRAVPWNEALSLDGAWAYLEANVTLLHCTTEYPAPFRDVNLRAMDTLASAFGLPVGYSDHTVGIAVPVAAVARGASIVEKHFTLDRTMVGPDHAASLEPEELTAMVSAIRDVESALGSSRKMPSRSELANVAPARRSLVATRTIREGELFTRENLGAKRPGTGISPMRLDEWVGQTAPRDYEQDDLIDFHGKR